MKMNRVFLAITLVFCSIIAEAQTKIGNIYVGAILHDFNQPGVSAVYNFNIGRIIGIGAGAEITGYEKKALIPLYADLKVKIPMEKVQPYLNGQFGYAVYNNEATYNGGLDGSPSKVKGGTFFSPGAGIVFKRPKVGFFLQYNHRFYNFDAEYNPQIPDRYKLSIDTSPSIGVIMVGVVF